MVSKKEIKKRFKEIKQEIKNDICKIKELRD